MQSYQELKQEAEKLLKEVIENEIYSYTKREKIIEQLSQAMDLAYKQGREDQRYKDNGPRSINLYKT